MVEGGARAPPAPPGAVGGVVALGHPAEGELGGERCLRAEGVQGVGEGWVQPPAKVGGVEGVGAGGQQVLVGEVGLEPEPEHLQGKEEVGEMVTQQGMVPPPRSLCHRISPSPRAHSHTPASVSVPRALLPTPPWRQVSPPGRGHPLAPTVPVQVAVVSVAVVASPEITGAAGVSMTTGTISMATSPSGPRRICTSPFSSSSASRRSSASR